MIDMNHPDYILYKKKYDKIWKEQEEEIERWEKTHYDKSIFDESCGNIYKKYAKKIKELQIEFFYLFR